MGNRQIVLRLPADLDAALSTESDRRGCSVQEIILETVSKRLKVQFRAPRRGGVKGVKKAPQTESR